MNEEEAKKVFGEVLKNTGLIDDIRHIKTVCEQTNVKLATVITEVEKLKAENEEVRKELKKLKEENMELGSRLEELDQYGRKNDIIVRNIPEVQNENAKKIITDIIKTVGVEINEYDITVAHRLPTHKGEKPIIARFHSIDKKRETIRAVKKSKPSGKDLGLNTTMPIFFDEHLTRETKQRWAEAKEMVEAGILSSARCFDGKIKVKEREDGPAIVYGSRDSTGYNEWKSSRAKSNNKRNLDARSPEEAANKGRGENSKIDEMQKRAKSVRIQAQTPPAATSATTIDNNQQEAVHEPGKINNNNNNYRRFSQPTLELFKWRKS